MNSEPLTKTHSPTSQAGRKWLQKADILISNDDAGTAATGNTIVVSIPDVGSEPGMHDEKSRLFSSEEMSSQTIAQALAEATETALNEIDDAIKLQTDTARSDLPEKTTDWTDQPETKESNRSGSKQTTKSEQNEAIEPLVQAILERFPLAEPAVLLFVGSESNSHIDETCARVSNLLAARNVGRILLVDSDIIGHELSRASGLVGEPGISEVLNQNVAWKPLIYGGSATGLDFFPSGCGQFTHAKSQARLRTAIAEIKQEYQFICVSAGDAHSDSAKIWSDICDGSYLLVSMKNSNETFAKSAVTELQSSGARLLGCVVTDVP